LLPQKKFADPRVHAVCAEWRRWTFRTVDPLRGDKRFTHFPDPCRLIRGCFRSLRPATLTIAHCMSLAQSTASFRRGLGSPSGDLAIPLSALMSALSGRRALGRNLVVRRKPRVGRIAPVRDCDFEPDA
jgi:hypothetical protein